MEDEREQDIVDDLIARVKAYQEKYKLSQAAIARKSGVTPPALSYLMKRRWAEFGYRVFKGVIQVVVPQAEQDEYIKKFASIWITHKHSKIEIAPGSE
jgi:hypothetical protein